LTIILFGVYPQPELPDYFEYHQRPENLRQLYNQSAIFVSPSFGEGWALPPAEAMACGCAVVSTRIGGHLDYAIENQSALLFAAGEEEEMYEKMKMILQNETLANQIAVKGHEFITNHFSWEQSVNKLEDCFLKSL
jgi:glycosyltransferase involved in cell wall biosynthesis